MVGNTQKIFLSMVIAVVILLSMGLVAAFSYRAGRDSVIVASPPSVSVDVTVAVSKTPDATASAIPASATAVQLDDSTAVSAVPTLTPIPTSEAVSGPTATTTPESTVRNPVQLEVEDLGLMTEVWDVINEEFDGLLPEEDEVVYHAIQGSLDLLEDEFTRFVPPDVAQRNREQLNGGFEGIGAYAELSTDGYLVIVRPIVGQPAANAGVLGGDIVTHVDSRPVLGKLLDEIIAEIRGPSGTEVTLTIQREALPEPLDITIVRDLIEFPIVESEIIEQNIAYVRLTSFNSNANRRLREELESLLEQEPRGLILDLRDNPGGFLNQSVGVADLFLPDGVVLYQRDRNGHEEVFESDTGDPAEQIPLVVLVGPGSASASEIVAGAVQDRGRGTVIGENTFGKGSVQTTHTLSDGSELRVTIARWYTPNNITIDAQGITPDIFVESPANFGGSEDEQLNRAIRYVLTGE
jgi:carboxyl-terminal processing protease